MQIIFPNPYGYKLPKEYRVRVLQKQYQFSDAYADFLLTQNGFLFDSLVECPDRAKFIVPSAHDPEHYSDLRVLYGFDSGDEYYDLEDCIESLSIFQTAFFPIGSGYGGNDYVEVLHGKFKGYIGSLDHEMYAGNSGIDDFLEDMGLEGFPDMTRDEQTDALADPELGLLWLHASSMTEFVQDCIYCDDGFRGFARDAKSVTKNDA
jgi:hypothetical protein